MPKSDPLDWRGLPNNLDAERFVLGSILLDDSRYLDAAYVLTPEDFALRRHRLIFERMADIYERHEHIDRVTVANELLKHNQLEEVEGLTYLISLDDGLPHISSIESYVRIVRDKSILRKVCYAAQSLRDEAIVAQDNPTELLARAEKMLVSLGIEASSDETFSTPGDVIRKAGNLQNYLNRDKGECVPTGYGRLDRMTGGMAPGQLWILAAGPKCGKSSLARNITLNAARAGYPGAFITLEMNETETTDGFICAHGGIDNQIIRRGLDRETDRVRRAASELADMPIYIRDKGGCTNERLNSELRKLKAEKGIRYAVVDYLGLMDSGGRYENRNVEVSKLTRGLKRTASDLGIPMLVLCQLNRESRKGEVPRRPQLTDLRDSGSIEQDANVVLFVFSDVTMDNLAVYPTEVIVAAQRGGPTGSLPFGFEKSTGIFREFDEYRKD